jgi:hypothetical protein
MNILIAQLSWLPYRIRHTYLKWYYIRWWDGMSKEDRLSQIHRRLRGDWRVDVFHSGCIHAYSIVSLRYGITCVHREEIA